MSGESAQHVKLVERLIATIEERHQTTRGIVVFADHHRFGKDHKPPTIGAYKPDVFAQDVPETFRIIGEAKTPNDFNNDRSLCQIAAFLDHLALRTNSAFYLAVPWFLKGRANFVIRHLSKPEHRLVKITVLAVA